MPLLPADTTHGWTPYVWLVYAVPFIVFPAVYGPGTYGWLPHAAGLAVFLSLYFRAYWVDGTERLAFCVALALLGVVLTPINAGAAIFFVYAASFVGEVRTGVPAVLWIGGITATGVVTAWWAHWFHPALVSGVAVFAPLIGFLNVHYAMTRRRDGSLALAQAEIARLAADAERHRIAADVHDVLGQSLSLIVLKAELASKLLSRDGQAAAAEVADIEQTSRQALAEVRRVVTGIRAASLATEWDRARSVLSTAGVYVTRQPETIDPAVLSGVAPQAEHALAMAVREAVTNVIRHARATTCRLVLTPESSVIRCEVADNGVGGVVEEGNGLRGMRARLLEVRGAFTCESGSGTRLTFSVPRPPAEPTP